MLKQKRRPLDALSEEDVPAVETLEPTSPEDAQLYDDYRHLHERELLDTHVDEGFWMELATAMYREDIAEQNGATDNHQRKADKATIKKFDDELKRFGSGEDGGESEGSDKNPRNHYFLMVTYACASTMSAAFLTVFERIERGHKSLDMVKNGSLTGGALWSLFFRTLKATLVLLIPPGTAGGTYKTLQLILSLAESYLPADHAVTTTPDLAFTVESIGTGVVTLVCIVALVLWKKRRTRRFLEEHAELSAELQKDGINYLCEVAADLDRRVRDAQLIACGFRMKSPAADPSRMRGVMSVMVMSMDTVFSLVKMKKRAI